jgi:hypothetical protein
LPESRPSRPRWRRACPQHHHPRKVALDRIDDALGEVVRHPEGGGGNAAADRLPDHEDVRLEAVCSRVAAWANADRVGLVDGEERSVPPRQGAELLVEARFWHHHPDVRQCGLGKHDRHVLVCELAFERLEVVELDHTGGQLRGYGRAEAAAPRYDVTGVEGCEALVDRAVVAVVENEDLRPARNVTGVAKDVSVRVGCAERELPEGKPETTRKLLAHNDRVLTRQHRRHPPSGLLLYGANRRRWGVAGHRTRVTEAEVDVPTWVVAPCWTLSCAALILMCPVRSRVRRDSRRRGTTSSDRSTMR